MPLLPLSAKLFANVDEIGNSVAVTKRIDMVLDDLGNNVPRFRLAAFADLGALGRIDGIFTFYQADFIATVCAGRLFKVERDGTVTEITFTSGGLEVSSRVSMADFGTSAYFANGGRIYKWVLTEATASPLDTANTPTNATHITFFNQFLIACEADSQRFAWSDVGLPDTWLGEFATAGVRPDNLVGIYSAFGEIFAPGTESIEYWTDTGDISAPFALLPGTLTERGIIAPDSVCFVDNSWFFLDEERRVIRLEGRSPKVVSNSIDKEIQGLSTVSDAVGFPVIGSGQTLYILTFPTAGRSFAYNYKMDDWSEFTFWDDQSGTRTAFRAASAVYQQNWGQTILGSRLDDGKLYAATFDQDTDDGASVVGEIWTGHIDWKAPSLRKRSNRLRITLKRGTAGFETDANIQVCFRDDGKTAWGTLLNVSLGKAGDEYAHPVLSRLGAYRSRQWRFLFPSVHTVLVSADETVEV